MGIIESPIFWVVLAAVSEILALIPNEKLKSNSVFQLLAAALTALLKDRKSKLAAGWSDFMDLSLAICLGGHSPDDPWAEVS